MAEDLNRPRSETKSSGNGRLLAFSNEASLTPYEAKVPPWGKFLYVNRMAIVEKHKIDQLTGSSLLPRDITLHRRPKTQSFHGTEDRQKPQVTANGHKNTKAGR